METSCDDVESEQFSEAFLCCICLDLLYKPVVLACGHVSCFWCVHKSMSILHESLCPICRHPYYHFPTICQMLHFLLVKMYPVAYKRRENQILEEEKEIGFFSPNFDHLLCASHANEESHQLGDQAQSSATSRDKLSIDLSSIAKGEPCANMEQLKFVTNVQDNVPTIPKQITTESFGVRCPVGFKEENLPQRSSNGICQQVSIDDVLCAACKQLLVQPVVLNCGHVYCETCVIPADEAIKCQVCQSPHPTSFPRVFMELDHFLEEQFPKEYAARRNMVQLKQTQFQNESPPTRSTKAGKPNVPFPFCTEESFFHWWGDHGSKVHIGAGCDSCGMYPIIGDRYRCLDCKEAVGYDLCGDCYNTRSKLPGRFNQQHTPDHRFELTKIPRSSGTIQNLILGMLSRQLEDGSPAPIPSDGDPSENPENNFLPSTLSENVEENTENGSVAPSTSSGTEEHQNDDEQPTM